MDTKIIIFGTILNLVGMIYLVNDIFVRLFDINVMAYPPTLHSYIVSVVFIVLGIFLVMHEIKGVESGFVYRSEADNGKWIIGYEYEVGPHYGDGELVVDANDFDSAVKKAKEEIEKLSYDNYNIILVATWDDWYIEVEK